MGAIEEGGRVATGVVTGLSNQPLALALIVVNLIFLIGGGWVLHDVSEKTTAGNIRRDQMLADIMRDCRGIPHPPTRDERP